MLTSITRRVAVMAPLIFVSGRLLSRAEAESSATSIEVRLKQLETRSGGRLGVAVLNAATGQLIGHRLDERFAMCSTFKALAIALTLARVDRGEERLDRRLVFGERDLVRPFMATEPHLADGMTIEQLCEAAAIYSDSTAANLLLASFGGPTALTGFLRSLDDEVSRLDLIEPELNVVEPGQVHDTTSPRAMVHTLQRIMLGDALSASSRARLTTWLSEAKGAAARRLRVGVPQSWRVANKPGTWDGISTNDVGVIFPPGRAPIVVAAYLGEAPGPIADQEVVLADVARIVSASV